MAYYFGAKLVLVCRDRVRAQGHWGTNVGTQLSVSTGDGSVKMCSVAARASSGREVHGYQQPLVRGDDRPLRALARANLTYLDSYFSILVK